jgi:hypothetical protein
MSPYPRSSSLASLGKISIVVAFGLVPRIHGHAGQFSPTPPLAFPNPWSPDPKDFDR